MLSLSAGHLKALRAQNPHKRLIWVDIGGGTGSSPPLFSSAERRVKVATQGIISR